MNEKEAWELWSKEFNNAKSFFTSKGNSDTKERHKIRWYREFIQMIRRQDGRKKER